MWRSSAQRHGWRPTVLDLGTPWRGWKARAAAIAAALARLGPSDLVLVTDAYDVCVTNTPASLCAVVGAKAVLVGTERTARLLVARLPLHPSGKVDAARARERDFGFSARLHEDSPGLTINCGAFAGRAAPLAAALRSVAVSQYSDDQAAWGGYRRRRCRITWPQSIRGRLRHGESPCLQPLYRPLPRASVLRPPPSALRARSGARGSGFWDRVRARPRRPSGRRRPLCVAPARTGSGGRLFRLARLSAERRIVSPRRARSRPCPARVRVFVPARASRLP